MKEWRIRLIINENKKLLNYEHLIKIKSINHKCIIKETIVSPQRTCLRVSMIIQNKTWEILNSLSKESYSKLGGFN